MTIILICTINNNNNIDIHPTLQKVDIHTLLNYWMKPFPASIFCGQVPSVLGQFLMDIIILLFPFCHERNHFIYKPIVRILREAHEKVNKSPWRRNVLNITQLTCFTWHIDYLVCATWYFRKYRNRYETKQPGGF